MGSRDPRLGPLSTPDSKKEKSTNPEAPPFIEVNNSRSVLEKIADAYAEQLMSDISLIVGGVTYPAHRVILCATSEVFQVMLMNREWSEWNEKSIVLKETPQCAAVFPHFLKYFYTGLIRISQDTALPVLSLADKYNIPDLVAVCISFMKKHIAHAVQQGHLVEWLQYTMACGHSDVAKECQNFVKWNFETIAETSDFGNFEPDVFISFINRNDLVVHNEMSLYKNVVKWLEHQKNRLHEDSERGLTEDDIKSHMDYLVLTTMSHIRFPMMSPRQLAELLLHPLTQHYKEYFVERMALGMSFHSGHTTRINEVFATDEGKYLFTPRLYTEDRWCSMLMIENFHSLQCYHTRTFVFSSHLTFDEYAGDKTCEWVVDVYPKGVWFKKALLISWASSFEVPEAVLRKVRLAITCRDPPEPKSQYYYQDELYMRVKIGILISGLQWGIEYVTIVKERVFHFSQEQRVLNIDDVLDFDELNTPIYSPSLGQPQMQNANKTCTGRHNAPCSSKKCLQCVGPDPPPNLVGPNRDQLKIQVVIIPLSKVTCLYDVALK